MSNQYLTYVHCVKELGALYISALISGRCCFLCRLKKIPARRKTDTGIFCRPKSRLAGIDSVFTRLAGHPPTL